jgi:cytochrome b6-f complex iron-sulfur subunit
METRRHFFKKILGVLGFGLVAFRSGVARAKKLAIKLDKVPTLKKVGGSATVKMAGMEILFIRDTSTTVRGVSPKCTHEQCPLTYNHKRSKIDCACHGSLFTLDGEVIKGPATVPIKTYETKLDNNRIIVKVD